jgi:hypothetical protein
MTAPTARANSLSYQCPGPDSNRHGDFSPWDFKSHASTNFATRAGEPLGEKLMSFARDRLLHAPTCSPQRGSRGTTSN